MDKDIRFTDKKVDESWKDQAVKDASKLTPKAEPKTEGSAAASTKKEVKTSRESQKKFVNFLMSLATQALYLMGLIEGAEGRDLEAAREMIDILQLLKERTAGNLSDEEARALEKILYDLQMQFVHVSEGGVPPPAGAKS